ncbi:putative cleavage induced protein [Achlya hypogyna]|uniref:Putative cleavage induced protein n=1 Tax=Achlya hypogyna TaxID=1202772 RepID=A0A1V9YN51_ACHHY|nr:putative cleavage induced protein [Achlya hypogyna]
MHNGKKDNKVTKFKTTQYYVCSAFRRIKCPVRLAIKGGTVTTKYQHNCEAIAEEQHHDARAQMHEILTKQCLADRVTPPGLLWKRVKTQLLTEHGQGILIMPREPAVAWMYRCRKESSGGDIFREVETPPTCFIAPDDKRYFLQFNTTTIHKKKMCRIMGFAHPSLVSKRQYPDLSLFIDGTFRDNWAYWEMLNQVKIQCDVKIFPSTVSCDFEKGLISAVRDQFPDARLVGCLFHLKQAFRRKMVSLRIPKEQIQRAMEPGVMDVLTSLLVTEDHGRQWFKFWDSFKDTWLKQYDVSTWNVNFAIDSDMELLNRTNNPLEKCIATSATSFQPPTPGLFLRHIYSVDQIVDELGVREGHHHLASLREGGSQCSLQACGLLLVHRIGTCTASRPRCNDVAAFMVPHAEPVDADRPAAVGAIA